jgi:pimeloyl-ACP methyl ester carboxylesterase
MAGPSFFASRSGMVEFFDSDGARIAYIDVAPRGPQRGQPILLIHGFASSHRVNWVETGWVEALAKSGRRVVAFDNRGHGESAKLYDPAAYACEIMARDAANLLDRLGLPRVDVMGYSMGARIGAFLALGAPERVRRLVLGGLGDRLIDGPGLPDAIAAAMEASSLADLVDPTQRMFRDFADRGGADRAALAACVRGSRQALSEADVRRIACPTLVAVGTRDEVAGDAHRLAALLPQGRAFAIPRRAHNPAVGDKSFKAAVLAFLDEDADASFAAP